MLDHSSGNTVTSGLEFTYKEVTVVSLENSVGSVPVRLHPRRDRNN